MKEVFDLDEYQRLFEVSDLPFIVNDILMKNYKNYDGLFLFDGSTWSSYIPHSVVKRTNEEGKILFSSYEKSKYFHDSFLKAQKKAKETYSSFLSKKKLTKKDIEAFFDAVVIVHTYYIYLEFFYTDEFAKHSLGKEDLAEQIAFVGNLKNSGRKFLTSVFFGDDSVLAKGIKKLSSYFDIHEKDLFNHSIYEVVSLLDEKRVHSDLLNKRSQGYVSTKEKTIYTTILPQKESNTNFLSGISAHQGKVTAPVFVLKYSYSYEEFLEQIKKMPHDVILVTETTSPELFVACKKASGIITDQGGLLSHAAIISRELNIPCMVGTENATSKLKSGDIITLDTINGEIKRKNQ